MNYDEIFDKNFEEFYWDLRNAEHGRLLKEDKEYKDNFEEMRKIWTKKELEFVIDGSEYTNLNKKDVELLMKYMTLNNHNESIMGRSLFLLGLKTERKIEQKLNSYKDDLA